MKKFLDSPKLAKKKFQTLQKKLNLSWLYVTGGMAYFARWLLLKVFMKNYEKRIRRVTQIHSLLLRVYGLTLIAQVDPEKKMVTLAYVPAEKANDVQTDGSGKSQEPEGSTNK